MSNNCTFGAASCAGDSVTVCLSTLFVTVSKPTILRGNTGHGLQAELHHSVFNVAVDCGVVMVTSELDGCLTMSSLCYFMLLFHLISLANILRNTLCILTYCTIHYMYTYCTTSDISYQAAPYTGLWGRNMQQDTAGLWNYYHCKYSFSHVSLVSCCYQVLS